MNRFTRFSVATGLLLLAGCSMLQSQKAVPEIHTLGANANFGKGDFSSHANLADFRHTPHLYAVGPVQHLGGEVLVIDSVPYAVEVRDGHLQVISSWDYAPPFLVYSQVARWRELEVPETVQTYTQLESWISAAAGKQGLDPEQPFAFRLRARTISMTVTVMNRPASAVPGERPLREFQTSWEVGGVDTDFVGFYSTRHAGVFLGNEEKVHIHAITHDRRLAGHVLDFRLAPGASLYLPARR